MRSGSVFARLWLAALACAGIASAHWLAYFAAGTHGHLHDELLSSTGHAYWPYFAAVSMAALVAALARPVIQGFRAGPNRTGIRFIPTVLVLAVVQVGGFLALEVGERMLFAQGHSLNVLSESVVLWGLALQVVTAVVATIVVRLLARVGEFVARLRWHRIPATTTSTPWFTSQTYAPALAPASGGPSLRAPPFVR